MCGDKWITTHGAVIELWRLESGSDSWQNLSSVLGIGTTRGGSAFVEDKAGNLWIGTGSDANDTALIRYRDGQFKIFTQAEYPLLSGWMRDLFVDDKGRLWIADTITGVLRLDDVNADQLDFKRYTPAEGLSSKGLSHKKFNFLSISNKLLKLSAKSSSCAFLLRHFVSLKTFVTNVRIPARIRFEFFF